MQVQALFGGKKDGVSHARFPSHCGHPSGNLCAWPVQVTTSPLSHSLSHQATAGHLHICLLSPGPALLSSQRPLQGGGNPFGDMGALMENVKKVRQQVPAACERTATPSASLLGLASPCV